MTGGMVSLLRAAWTLMPQPVRWSGKATHTRSVEPARLEAHVRMLAETLVPRDAGHPDTLDRVAASTRQEFERARGQVWDQPCEGQGKTYRNVSARFGPDTQDRSVVGAHYAAAGEPPAADDNASGVAGLIELAHLLGTPSLPLRSELVAVTLEELPYCRTTQMGRAVHAAWLKQQGIPGRGRFSLEMSGYFTAAPPRQGFPASFLKAFYPWRGNFIALVSKLAQGRGGPAREESAAERLPAAGLCPHCSQGPLGE
ncbi:MAG: M28 family peptidase [Deltaproteobacteria bacterium]|nr:M28 family peptidase [Deltaproteobacteria bacterium]